MALGVPGFTFQVNLRDLNRFNAKAREIIDFFKVGVPNLTREQAMDAASMAAGLAPKRSEALVSAIGYGKAPNKSYMVYSGQPKHSDGRNRPYHLWMHGLGRYDTSKGKYRPKSGYPKYMFRVFDTIKKEYPDKVNKRLGKIIRK